MQRQSINIACRLPLKGIGLALMSFALTHAAASHAGLQSKLVPLTSEAAKRPTVPAPNAQPKAGTPGKPERIRLLPGQAPVLLVPPTSLRRDSGAGVSPLKEAATTSPRVHQGADEVLSLPVSVVDTSPPPSYTMRITPQDRRVSDALRTFLSTHGWNLSWEVDRDFPILFDASFTGDVLDIVEQVARALQNVDTPIRVKAYHANKVLRVLYATY